MNILTTSLKIPSYSWLWICLISGLPKLEEAGIDPTTPRKASVLPFEPILSSANDSSCQFHLSIQIFFRPFRIHWWLYAHQSQIVWNGIEIAHKQPWTEPLLKEWKTARPGYSRKGLALRYLISWTSLQRNSRPCAGQLGSLFRSLIALWFSCDESQAITE